MQQLITLFALVSLFCFSDVTVEGEVILENAKDPKVIKSGGSCDITRIDINSDDFSSLSLWKRLKDLEEPVLITGLINHWNALKTDGNGWSNTKKFLKNYGKVPVPSIALSRDTLNTAQFGVQSIVTTQYTPGESNDPRMGNENMKNTISLKNVIEEVTKKDGSNIPMYGDDNSNRALGGKSRPNSFLFGKYIYLSYACLCVYAYAYAYSYAMLVCVLYVI